MTEPAFAGQLDPRVRVVDTKGEPGARGSSFTMEYEDGARRVRATVLESDPPWRCVIGYGGLTSSMRQTGELTDTGDGTQLHWTVAGKAFRLRKGANAVVRAELVRWLAAVASVSENIVR